MVRPKPDRTAVASARGSGNPNTATLLTWFLPGAGHLYLGRARTAFVGFVCVQGLYVLGWMLSGGRAFEFLDPELRGPLATALAPEVANLGAMIAQLKLVGFGPSMPRPFSSSVELGSMLTAVSGLANACLMVHANFEARYASVASSHPRTKTPRGLHPAWLVGAAWAVPGLGHFLQGRVLRGAIVFVLLVGFFALGTALCDGANLSRERHFYYWSGQFLLGLPALVTEIFSGRPPVTSDLPAADVGLLYASMAGLLNVLALIDVHGVAERRFLGDEDGPASGDASPLTAEEG